MSSSVSICLCLNCLEKADGEEEKRGAGGLTLSETEGESVLEKESSSSIPATFVPRPPWAFNSWTKKRNNRISQRGKRGLKQESTFSPLQFLQ